MEKRTQEGSGEGLGCGAVQGISDFPYLKLGIRGFKVKQERDSGLKVCAGGVMPKITLGITGLHEIMGRDTRLENLIWEPLCRQGKDYSFFATRP